MQVIVLGGGSWGTALAALAAKQASTTLWARDPSVVDDINHNHYNRKYLDNIALPPQLRATHALAPLLGATTQETLIILGVPVAAMPTLCQALQQLPLAHCPNISVLWTCKGLQPDTGTLTHQVVKRTLATPLEAGLGIGVLSGPSFAKEVAQGLPVALTVATQHAATARRTTQVLHGQHARIYSSTDIIGVETGGALKNVMAIACGISDGLQLGDNARAALITRGLAEIQRLGLALGGKTETFFGLTGLGDLVLTTTGALSRNRQVGLAIGQGQSLEAVLATGVTAEGVYCVKAALTLGKQHDIELPITEAVYQVLFQNLSPETAVRQLLDREARAEGFAS